MIAVECYRPFHDESKGITCHTMSIQVPLRPSLRVKANHPGMWEAIGILPDSCIQIYQSTSEQQLSSYTWCMDMTRLRRTLKRPKRSVTVLR